MEGYGVRLIGIVLWALIPGFIAKGKGRSFWGYFFLSFLISPLITMIITICLSNLNKEKYYTTSRPISTSKATSPQPTVSPKPVQVPSAVRPAAPAKAPDAPPLERGQLPRYVALDHVSTSSTSQTEYRFQFATYDEDFARKCAQAVIRSAKVVISVLVADSDGKEANILRSIQSCGMKVTEHPELTAGSPFLIVDALIKTDRFKFELRPGTKIITVLASNKLPDEDAVLLMDRMVHQALTEEETSASSKKVEKPVPSAPAPQKTEKPGIPGSGASVSLPVAAANGTSVTATIPAHKAPVSPEVAPQPAKNEQKSKKRPIIIACIAVLLLATILTVPPLAGNAAARRNDHAAAKVWYSLSPFTGAQRRQALIAHGHQLREQGDFPRAINCFSAAGEIAEDMLKQTGMEYALSLTEAGQYSEAVEWFKLSGEVGLDAWIQVVRELSIEHLLSADKPDPDIYTKTLPETVDKEALCGEICEDAVISLLESKDLPRAQAILKSMPLPTDPKRIKRLDQALLDSSLELLREAMTSPDWTLSRYGSTDVQDLLSYCQNHKDATALRTVLADWNTANLDQVIAPLENFHRVSLGDVDWGRIAQYILDHRDTLGLSGEPLMGMHCRVKAMTGSGATTLTQLRTSLETLMKADKGLFATPESGLREALPITSYYDVFNWMESSPDTGKILILRIIEGSYKNETLMIDLELMSVLPPEYYPRSFKDAQRVIVLDYGFTSQGTYNCGTKAIQEHVYIYCYRDPWDSDSDLAASKSGKSAPYMLSYYGTPPAMKSGGAPEITEEMINILATLMDLS